LLARLNDVEKFKLSKLFELNARTRRNGKTSHASVIR
jgi:hypothetical protein